MTKSLALGLAVVAFLAGLRAAYLWYRASRVQIVPMWGVDGRVEPVDPHLAQAEWIVALLETASKSGDLNRRAAIWTAVAVALSTASTLASFI
ncbi:MAG: hypothetical protein V4564_10070 [Pseudomonadota bacterium]